MTFVYSIHALEQIEIRGLIHAVVEDVLNFPSKVVKDESQLINTSAHYHIIALAQ